MVPRDYVYFHGKLVKVQPLESDKTLTFCTGKCIRVVVNLLVAWMLLILCVLSFAIILDDYVL